MDARARGSSEGEKPSRPIKVAVFLAAGIGLDPIKEHIEHFLGPRILIDLRRGKLALTDHLKAEIVLDVRFCRALHNVSNEMRGNEQHTAACAENNVTGV